MKIALKILVLFLISSPVFSQDNCLDAIKKAEQDFKNNKYSLHSVSFFPAENAYFDVLRMDYNISWYFTDSTEYYDCYDSIMSLGLKEKYGEDIFKIAGIKADSLNETGTWKRDAQFPGGQDELFKFIYNRLNEYSIHLDTIRTRLFVQIQIDTLGKVINLTILRGINDSFDRKVIKAFEEMPDWIPAYQYGKPFRQTLTIPINVDYK